jgi:protein-tyrosine phosphatase
MDLKALRASGFSFILSLDQSEYGLIREQEPGLEYKLIHLPNSIPPQSWEKKIYASRLPEAVDYVMEKRSQRNGAVLVHCHAGNDRTGGVLTGTLSRVRGITPREALVEVRAIHPEALSASGYEEMVLEILAAHG